MGFFCQIACLIADTRARIVAKESEDAVTKISFRGAQGARIAADVGCAASVEARAAADREARKTGDRVEVWVAGVLWYVIPSPNEAADVEDSGDGVAK